jgi:hypothetical protein
MTDHPQGLDHDHHFAAIPERGTPDRELHEVDLTLETRPSPNDTVLTGPLGVRVTHWPSSTTVEVTRHKSVIENQAEAVRQIRSRLGLDKPEPSMSGAEHYRKAESILCRLAEREELTAHQAQADLARAQVHATLALAAATLDAGFVRHPMEDGAWTGQAHVDEGRSGWGYGQ